MKVSVVIPTYKRSELLLKCIIKLYEQSFNKEDYEIIIISDGADLETESLINLIRQKFNNYNICYAALDVKKGPAAARNKGALLAKGELILFTDDDCLPHIEWIEKFWEAYILNNETLIAFTGKTIVPHKPLPTDYEKNVSHLEDAEFVTANCACTKKAFDLVKGFDEDFSIAWREDSEFQFRLIDQKIPILKIEEAIVEHPVRIAFWGVSIKEQKKSIFNALLYKKHPELYKEKISNKPVWNYYYMIIVFAVFIITIVTGNYTIALLSLMFWMMLVLMFTIKRLQGTSKKFSHIMEMFTTSIAIPFISIFWTLYGSIKFKTLLF